MNKLQQEILSSQIQGKPYYCQDMKLLLSAEILCEKRSILLLLSC